MSCRRFALVNLRGMFGCLPHQPAYHKRLKAAQPLLSKAILMLAEQCPSWFDDTWSLAALRPLAAKETATCPATCALANDRLEGCPWEPNRFSGGA